MPADPAAAPQPPRDHVRETFETLVFVVVLVLILQLFVLEAFVIPTGSMAETQLGYHKTCVCKQCGYQFPVNSADEVEKPGPDTYVFGYTCPNCEDKGRVDWNGRVSNESGDRVLVHKAMSPDERGRIVVFKYPLAPQKKQQAQNYIKRCVGFGGETVAIYLGDLYVNKSLKYPGLPRPADDNQLWESRYTYARDESAVAAFKASRDVGFPANVDGFELYRKPDELVMEMRRIVFDNDHQPADQKGGSAVRWTGRENDAAGWATDDPAAPKAFAHAGDAPGWIGYRHLRRSGDGKPSKITNAMGYNGGLDTNGRSLRPVVRADDEDKWVGDLMLECSAKTEAGGEVTLELSKGEQRFQAAFADGKVTLLQYLPAWPDGKATVGKVEKKVERPTPMMTKPGTYALRFANIDCRLRVWVNDTPIDFGGAEDYAPTAAGDKPNNANDIMAPASIGAKGGVTVSGLKLWRDTYYTPQNAPSDDEPDTFFVQPDHYLCMGDNSAQSSDGRSWGLVPKRLMIGRAVFTFWPRSRIGPIR